MSVQITVRGTAERKLTAEMATISLAVEIQGTDRSAVMTEATETHQSISSVLGRYADAQQVTRWSAEGVRVMAQRRWLPDGQRGELDQIARLSAQAQFVDFEALGAFIDRFAADERIEVGSILWGLTEENHREVSAEVRVEALADAVQKAQTYATAVGAGQVKATQIADPGMLDDSEPPIRAMAMVAKDSFGGGIELKPDAVVVRCEVDARFLAE